MSENNKPFEIPKNFPNHPGGQRTLDESREHSQKEILFLSNHMGLDIDGKIAQQAKTRGIQLPSDINNPLFREIHDIVQKVKKEHPEQVLVYQGWCMFLTLAIPTSLFAFVWTGNAVYIAIMKSCIISYAFNIFHMRNHRGGKIYETKWLNDWTSPLYDFIDSIVMTHGASWRKNHNRSHHIFTNDSAHDNDILSTARVGIRLSPDQPHYWFHRYQPIYIPMLFVISVLLHPLENCLVHGDSIFYLFVHYALFWVVPIWFHGWYAFWVMLGGFAYAGLTGACLIETSHNHPSCHNPETRKVIQDNNNDNDKNTSNQQQQQQQKQTSYNIEDFFRRQISESISWGGYIPTLLVGGINLQTEHHLAPNLPPIYYYYMKPYIRDFAKRHGIDYTHADSFWSAIEAYTQHLYAMSLGSTYPHKGQKKDI